MFTRLYYYLYNRSFSNMTQMKRHAIRFRNWKRTNAIWSLFYHSIQAELMFYLMDYAIVS